MKSFTIALLALWAGLSALHAQTVTTITSTTAKIDDDIIFDAQGNLFGSNYVGSRVFKRTPDGMESVFATGISSPNGMAFTDEGDIIIADNTGNKLYKRHPDGTKEVFVPSIAGPSGILRIPGSDTLVVTSYTTQKGWKLAPDGALIEYLTHPQFNGPVGLCYDDTLNLYIANFNDRKIFKMTPDGQLTFFTQPPLGQYIGFLAYANGYIYATAMNANKVYRIDLNGNYNVWLGSSAGSVDGDASVAKFSQPNGIRFSTTKDTLYVSDFGSKRVRMITQLGGTTGTKDAFLADWKLSVAPNPMTQSAQITFELQENTTASLRLYDEQGRLVQTVFDQENLLPGSHRYTLNRDTLPTGLYHLHLESDQGALQTQKVLVQ